MNRARCLFATVFVFVTASASAAPLTLVGSLGATGLWDTGDPCLEDNTSPGSLYWDGNSWDTHSMPDSARIGTPLPPNPANIGALLAGSTATLTANMAGHLGTPTFSLGANAPATFEYWLDANHAADPTYYFSLAQPYTFHITMLAEVARRNDVNEFGWYRQGDLTSRTPIFTALDGLGSTWTGTIDGSFGFYYSDSSRGLFYSTESALPGVTAGSGQQFALFRSADTYYLGLEDRFGPITERPCGPTGCSDYDYNDLLMSIEAEPVPEPATLVMLGTGLLGVGAFARRRQRCRD